MDDKEKLDRARKLILAEKYSRARQILLSMGDNPNAKKMLATLERIDPMPRTFDEMQAELTKVEAKVETVQAEVDQAEAELEQVETLTGQVQRQFRLSTAVLVFLGSLFGSLIGAAADLGEAVNTFQEFRSIFYPELCVVGSDTILGEGLGMAEAWAASFEESHDVRVRINPTGSTAGLRLAADGGCAHVLAMSEAMDERQQASLTDGGVAVHCAAEIGYDIIVFVTDINNPVTVVTRPVLSGLLNGRTFSWGELSTDFEYPVSILVREGSGTTDVVLRQIANYDSRGATNFPPGANYVFCDSNDDCLDRTLSARGSLYWVSAAWMSTQPPQYLRVLSILQGDESSVNPLREEVDLNRYPSSLQRPLYMYALDGENTSDEQHQLARGFLRHVRGVGGQQVLEENFFYTHFNEPTEVDVPLPSGFDPPGTPGRQICLR